MTESSCGERYYQVAFRHNYERRAGYRRNYQRHPRGTAAVKNMIGITTTISEANSGSVIGCAAWTEVMTPHTARQKKADYVSTVVSMIE